MSVSQSRGSRSGFRSFSRLAWGVVVSSCIALVGQGCNDFLNPRPYRGGGGGTLSEGGIAGDSEGGTGPDPFACSSCVYQYCSAQQYTCYQDPDCVLIDTCERENCPLDDSACVQACIASDTAGSGQVNFRSYFACEQQYECSICAASCAPAIALCGR
ncbi:MAG TPA: hypothetical protein VNO21_22525 [Polyangiaceae bacterium]|nr:hypothetical protein [Polyangiaceae bacterium]